MLTMDCRLPAGSDRKNFVVLICRSEAQYCAFAYLSLEPDVTYIVNQVALI